MLKLDKIVGKELTLRQMDNKVLELLGGGESITEYGQEWWGEYEPCKYAFSYQDRYNIYFTMLEKNTTDIMGSIVEVTKIDLI